MEYIFTLSNCFSAFGTSTSSGGLFGTTNTTSNPFGGTTSLFGSSGFASTQPGTTVKFNVGLIFCVCVLLGFYFYAIILIRKVFDVYPSLNVFQPPTGSDTMVKSGVTTSINTKHQCITAMKEYENKSLEVRSRLLVP